MPAARAYEIRLFGALPPSSITFKDRDVPFGPRTDPTAAGWRYDGNTLTTVITLPRSDVGEPVAVLVKSPPAGSDPPALAAGYTGTLRRLAAAMRELNNTWPKGWAPDSLVEAIQTPSRIEIDPSSTAAELTRLAERLPAIAADIRAMEVDANAIARALAHLGLR
jgi:alpha-glucosidase